MHVENEPTYIEEVSASRITPEVGGTITKLLGSTQCKSTAIKQSCSSKNCKLVLHHRKQEVVHTNLSDVDGFITITETSPTTAEIFNLCSTAVYINKELLAHVIEYNDYSELWIGLRFDSSHFDENAILFATLGFTNPVMTKLSPSGIVLNYEFIGLKRSNDNGDSQYKETVVKIMSMKNDYFSSKDKVDKIKFKTFPAGYKPNIKVGANINPVVEKKMEKAPIVKSPERKKSPVKDVAKKVSIGNITVGVDNYIDLYRRNGKAVQIQAKCLENYTPKGRLINKSELRGKDINKVYEILKEGGYIHEGTYGVVYQACDTEKNCNYVIKIQIIEDEDDLKTWRKEVEIMIKFNEYGIGPHVSAAWTCTDGTRLFGIFAAEKWDGNLGDGDVEKCPPKHLIDKLESQIKTIHKLGYVHGDIMPKNVLVKKDSKGNITDLTITDFGTVDTPANWKLEQSSSGWIDTFYSYHTEGYFRFLYPYYKNSRITIEDVRKSPGLMDYDLPFYLRQKC